MTTCPNFRSFYQRWVSEFGKYKKPTSQNPDSFWEGATACKELMDGTDWLLVLVPTTDTAEHPFTSLFELLWREIESYRRIAGRIVDRNKEFRSAEAMLEIVQKQLQSIGRNPHMPDLRRLLLSLSREVSKTSEKVEKLQQTAIKDSLKQYKIIDPGGTENWVPPDKTDPLIPYPPPDIELREKALGNIVSPEGLKTNREYDSVFQIRLGHLFRLSLPLGSVSLSTIARLVVLSYICADLTKEQVWRIKRPNLPPSNEPALVIQGAKCVLMVDGVYQKLRRSGLR